MQVPIQPRRLVPEREAAQCPRATTQWFHWCLWALFLPWLLTWSGAKANLLNAFYRKNRTSPSWNGGGGGGGWSIPPIFGGFLISVCMPSGDRMNTIDLHVTGNIKQNGTCAQRYFYFLEIISEAWELLWQRKDCLCSCGATVWWGRGYRYMQQSSVTYIPDALSTFPVSPEPY